MNIDNFKVNKIISVILPVYNGEQYISEAIDGVLSQRLSDWELIIVDDASTDKTPAILQEYIKKDNRIKIIHNNKNLGLPTSLNKGFMQAKGDYLTWTSDDNYYLPDALEEMRKYLENHMEKPMVCANMYIKHGREEGVIEGIKFDIRRMYVDNCVGACFMYRREAQQIVGDYDSDLFGVEDYDYWLRMLKHYGEIGHLDEYLYVYRVHEKSLTATKAQMIKYRLSYLICRESGWMFEKIQDDNKALYSMYSHLEYMGEDPNNVKERIIKRLPAVKYISKEDNGRSIILYGAGRICDEAMMRIPVERISYIADIAFEKQGKRKNGITIISLKELVKIQDYYQILITVGKGLMYEVMRNLMDAGIKKYCPYTFFDERETIR